MTRVFLLLALGLAAALYFPESRAAILEKAMPALNPAFRWQSQHEMAMIADEVSIYERDKTTDNLRVLRGFTRAR